MPGRLSGFRCRDRDAGSHGGGTQTRQGAGSARPDAEPENGNRHRRHGESGRGSQAGRVEFKLDKNGNVAVPVGKFSFAENQLVENGTAVIEAVVRARPATAKGRFVEGMTLSATMSPGVHVDPSPYLTF